MEKQTNIKNVILEISKYKGVIFDLDGTLIDLGIDWKILKQELGKYCYSKKNLNIEFTPLDQKLFKIKKLFGKQFYSELLNIVSNFEMNETKYKFNKKLLDYVNSIIHPKIAIYSMNTKKCIDNIVRKYFQKKPDIIISKDNCIEPKPTGKDIINILYNLNITKKECLFIGDSESDYLCGQKAKIDFLSIDGFINNYGK